MVKKHSTARTKKKKVSTNPKGAKAAGNKMWGGRFASSPAEIMQKINASVSFDKNLASQDIAGSVAHCNMLVKQGVVPAKKGKRITDGLARIEEEINENAFLLLEELEDIHMNIESALIDKIGPDGGWLHTGRSRNDQVATDFKLWVREANDSFIKEIKALIKVLLRRAEQYHDTIMPGFTHLQVAQPVTLGHHLMAYVEMLGRDLDRFETARERMNECPLGAAALAGTSFNIDRKQTAKALKFREPTRNSIDSVSDRDFALDLLYNASMVTTHLSRLAEEFVIWASAQFAFISLSDKFTTGSSIMPQKRNPDAAELVRAKTGRVFGALQGLLTVMKGLPLTYSKDMQEDKEPVFDTAESLMLALRATKGMVADFKANKPALKEAAASGYSTATDLADWLVQNLNIPFRECHHISANIVALAEKKKCRLDQLELKELQSVEKRITKDIFNVLSVESSVNSRVSYGGTAPKCVKQQIQKAKKRFK